jgi:hypothetical protein
MPLNPAVAYSNALPAALTRRTVLFPPTAVKFVPPLDIGIAPVTTGVVRSTALDAIFAEVIADPARFVEFIVVVDKSPSTTVRSTNDAPVSFFNV